MRWIDLLAASLLVCVGTPAAAQTFGPPISGMCLLSRTSAIAASQAGKSLQAQLKPMQARLSAELAQQRGAIEQRRQQLQARQNTIAPIEYQRQLATLNQQAQSLDQQQNARFIAAQTQAQQQIDRALNAALSSVITRHSCSVVIERNSAYGWNNAMDITPAVTVEIDKILQTVELR